jgi:N-acetylglutamate synthase-like GNAT family acetyltransferase
MHTQTLLEYRNPTSVEFEQIIDYIREFDLDDRELQPHQFIAAFDQNELIGFGRIWKHQNCQEICTLGVRPEYRNKGVGRSIMRKLVKACAGNDIYLVCIIPDFFKPLNFEVVAHFPPEIKLKIDYCTSVLVVEESYVAMRIKQP